MKRIFIALFLIAAVPATVISCQPEEDQKKVIVDDGGKEEEETPVSTDVKLKLTTKGSNSVSMDPLDTYSYSLKLTGADPYVCTEPLRSAIDGEHLMLEFEYKSEKAVNALQIFYAFKGILSEGNSKKYGSLGATVVYKKYTINIAEFCKEGWGKATDCLRFDIGDDGGFTFCIRNIILRTMTDAEKTAYKAEQEKEASKALMAEHLTTYLSTDYSSEVTDVSVTADKVTVKGSCGGSGSYVLADVTPWEDVTELKTFPYTSAIKDKSFTISLDRYVKSREGITYDRVFSKWAVVKVDGSAQTLDSHARYADEVTAKTSPAAVPLKNKKGFGAGDISLYFQDCAEMNVGSITMNVLLNGFINGKGSDYTYGGVGYALDEGYRQSIDNILAFSRGLNLVVEAIILTPVESAYKDPENSGGYYTMPNLTTAEAFNMYAAALEYMASRYNTNAQGRISHWIMHNEVDMASDWTNMGDQPMMRLLDRYVKSMRICYNIVRQYDQNAAILGSYTHNWTQTDGGYSPKAMLEKTVEYSKAEGDFWWGVAYHPYAQDLTKPEFWKNDKQSTYSMDTKYVTFKNLEVIDKWIKLPENLYQGKTKRWLFLSEQGTNSPSYSDSDLALQAAGGAWAWKKAAKLDGIDAIQWHNWADNTQEFGLRIGLRTFAEGSYANLTPKPVWYVWKAGGTADESTIFDPYLSTIGISSWDDIFRDVQ